MKIELTELDWKTIETEFDFDHWSSIKLTAEYASGFTDYRIIYNFGSDFSNYVSVSKEDFFNCMNDLDEDDIVKYSFSFTHKYRDYELTLYGCDDYTVYFKMEDEIQ
jgi:hypothetical protein